MSGAEAHPQHQNRADQNEADRETWPERLSAMASLQVAAAAGADRRFVEAAPGRFAWLDAVSERVFVGAAHAAIGSQRNALFQSELHEPRVERVANGRRTDGSSRRESPRRRYCCGERRSRATSVGFAVGEAGQARPWKQRPVQGGHATGASSALPGVAGPAGAAAPGRFNFVRNSARPMLDSGGNEGSVGRGGAHGIHPAAGEAPVQVVVPHRRTFACGAARPMRRFGGRRALSASAGLTGTSPRRSRTAQ